MTLHHEPALARERDLGGRGSGDVPGRQLREALRRDTAFAGALGSVYDELSRLPQLNADDVARQYAPTHPLTIVPLATLMDSAELAIILAANIGGDSDSVASIAGAILGARHPGSVNEDWYGVVEAINDHRLPSFAEDLSALRA